MAHAARQVLEREAYISDDWHRREQQELFGRVWTFVGFTGDFRETGDYRCVNAGVFPLVVLRDRDGALRAYHNLCRHRGSRLLEGSGNAGTSIRCFYHNWTYDLSGRLVLVPQEAEAFEPVDKSCLGLKPARVETWRNLVFVHPDPDAGSLEDWMAGFGAKVGPHEIERLVEVSDVRYRCKANWKLVIENFIDGYHFFYLHPVSFGDADYTKQHWWPQGRHWMFHRPLKEGMDHDGQILPVIDGVDKAYGAGAYVIFPNLALFETATSWSTFHAIPNGPDETLIDIRLLVEPAALDALGTDDAPLDDMPDCVVSSKGPLSFHEPWHKDAHPLETDDAMLEDIYACEAMQVGLNSPAYEVGPLSKWEDSLAFFQANVQDFVQTNRSTPGDIHG